MYVKKNGSLIKLESNNMILGITNYKTFIVEAISLDDISYIFLYSDGLIENSKEEIEDREYHLEQVLLDAEGSEQPFLDKVLDKMVGNREYDDDITLCYIELLKNK